eukprot:3840424-Rhodomonas_salina.1
MRNETYSSRSPVGVDHCIVRHRAPPHPPSPPTGAARRPTGGTRLPTGGTRLPTGAAATDRRADPGSRWGRGERKQAAIETEAEAEK